jgi:hypothetical protein
MQSVTELKFYLSYAAHRSFRMTLKGDTLIVGEGTVLCISEGLSGRLLLLE